MKFPTWMPYAIACGLVVLTLLQEIEISRSMGKQRELQAHLESANDKVQRLEQSTGLISLRLISLEAKDPAYADARVFVAWDANDHRGTIALDGVPPAPSGQTYELWVLDPNAPAPLAAGMVTAGRTFAVESVSMPRPGFALTLEPAVGSAKVTGPILFAVAPAE